MNSTRIEFANVSKIYSHGGMQKTALENINLTLNQGEYIGLMGLNGSGKSTLTRLINGLIMPDVGKIYVNGLDTGCRKNIIEIRRLVGMVFQNPDNQLICPVVEEEIAFGLENLGLPVDEINFRIDWALQTLGLEEMRYRAPHLLSGGQKQKVALASVLPMMPDYLILDEPFSMLDPLSRSELLELLKTLNQQKGLTVILCSHNPEDFAHAQRLIVIDQGAIYLQGTPREVFLQTAKLAAIGLEPPGIYQLISQLTKAGIEIEDNISTITELVDFLWL